METLGQREDQDQSRPPEGLSDEISSYSEQGGRRAKKGGEAQFSTDHRGTKADNRQKQSMEDRELLQALRISDA